MHVRMHAGMSNDQPYIKICAKEQLAVQQTSSFSLGVLTFTTHHKQLCAICAMCYILHIEMENLGMLQHPMQSTHWSTALLERHQMALLQDIGISIT